MVEQDHPIVESEREVGQTSIVSRRVGEPFGISYRVVGGISDGSSGEARQTWQMDGSILFEQLLEFDEGVVRGGPGGGTGILRVEDTKLASSGFELKEGLRTQKAEPSHLFPADDTLEEK
jgi:hypothetical protein